MPFVRWPPGQALPGRFDTSAALELEGCCHFPGNQKDMRLVSNAAAVAVLLSRREGTPNFVLESMACGIPLVASDVADNTSSFRPTDRFCRSAGG